MQRIIVSGLLLLMPACSLSQSGTNASPTARLAQSDPFWHASPAHEQVAASVMAHALDVLGGLAVFRDTSSLEIKGTATGNSSTSFIWQIQGTEHRIAVSTDTSVYEQNSGAGDPFQTISGKAHRVEPHIDAAVFVPAAVGLMIYGMLNDPNYNLYSMSSESIGGEPMNVIHVASNATRLTALSTAQTWYFSVATGFPVRIVYHVFDSKHPLAPADAVADLSNFVTERGAKYPSVIDISLNGHVQQSWTVISVVANSSFQSGLFVNPESAR